MGKIVRVKDWEEFRSLVVKLHPPSIVYNVQRSPLSRPPIGLRLMFAHGDTQYVFIDFADGNMLKQTRIQLAKHENGEEYLRDEDLKRFLEEELGRKDLLILCPVWRLEFY
ncbi:MAG: hypothetical protein RMJ07_06035 [Nitrososphaerota archaeon]|nr:hypothetical protein [Candidatus Bathyarchaeota archaeon]MDW8049218.1 hypothetical protein [Nitrososphaerota archaeon]